MGGSEEELNCCFLPDPVLSNSYFKKAGSDAKKAVDTQLSFHHFQSEQRNTATAEKNVGVKNLVYWRVNFEFLTVSEELPTMFKNVLRV